MNHEDVSVYQKRRTGLGHVVGFGWHFPFRWDSHTSHACMHCVNLFGHWALFGTPVVCHWLVVGSHCQSFELRQTTHPLIVFLSSCLVFCWLSFGLRSASFFFFSLNWNPPTEKNLSFVGWWRPLHLFIPGFAFHRAALVVETLERVPMAFRIVHSILREAHPTPLGTRQVCRCFFDFDVSHYSYSGAIELVITTFNLPSGLPIGAYFFLDARLDLLCVFCLSLCFFVFFFSSFFFSQTKICAVWHTARFPTRNWKYYNAPPGATINRAPKSHQVSIRSMPMSLENRAVPLFSLLSISPESDFDDFIHLLAVFRFGRPSPRSRSTWRWSRPRPGSRKRLFHRWRTKTRYRRWALWCILLGIVDVETFNWHGDMHCRRILLALASNAFVLSCLRLFCLCGQPFLDAVAAVCSQESDGQATEGRTGSIDLCHAPTSLGSFSCCSEHPCQCQYLHDCHVTMPTAYARTK